MSSGIRMTSLSLSPWSWGAIWLFWLHSSSSFFKDGWRSPLSLFLKLSCKVSELASFLVFFLLGRMTCFSLDVYDGWVGFILRLLSSGASTFVPLTCHLLYTRLSRCRPPDERCNREWAKTRRKGVYILVGLQNSSRSRVGVSFYSVCTCFKMHGNVSARRESNVKF